MRHPVLSPAGHFSRTAFGKSAPPPGIGIRTDQITLCNVFSDHARRLLVGPHSPGFSPAVASHVRGPENPPPPLPVRSSTPGGNGTAGLSVRLGARGAATQPRRRSETSFPAWRLKPASASLLTCSRPSQALSVPDIFQRHKNRSRRGWTRWTSPTGQPRSAPRAASCDQNLSCCTHPSTLSPARCRVLVVPYATFAPWWYTVTQASRTRTSAFRPAVRVPCNPKYVGHQPKAPGHHLALLHFDFREDMESPQSQHRPCIHRHLCWRRSQQYLASDHQMISRALLHLLPGP